MTLSQLPRSASRPESIIETGRLVIDLDTHVALVEDRPVALTEKEYGIIELLSLRKGTILTKEMFLDHLYGGMDEPELKIIDVFVCKLRKKIAEATGGHHYIETVWGRGYVLRDPAAPWAAGASTLDENLAERIRAVLAGTGSVREVRMFGGLCFMLNGNMVAGASKRGLLVRVGKDQHTGPWRGRTQNVWRCLAARWRATSSSIRHRATNKLCGSGSISPSPSSTRCRQSRRD